MENLWRIWFFLILEYRSIANFALERRSNTRKWTEQCLEYMATNHISSNRLIYRYPPGEEPAQKEALLYYVISSKNIRWHPNSAPRCWDPDLLTKINMQNNMLGTPFSIHSLARRQDSLLTTIADTSCSYNLIGFTRPLAHEAIRIVGFSIRSTHRAHWSGAALFTHAFCNTADHLTARVQLSADFALTQI